MRADGFSVWPLLICICALIGCIDPVHDDAVAALGGEVGRHGPEHRPGQPCLTCHGGHGPGSPDFSVAGTVFDVRGSTNGMAGATVTITDASGSPPRDLVTNRAGNFYVRVDEWSPVFPLHVTVTGGSAKQTMTSRIGRDGSCATCHVGTDANSHMPGVYASDIK